MISNQYIEALCHRTYQRGVANDKPQVSQLLSKIGTEKFTGKEMAYATQWDDGGNFGGINHEFVINNINANDAGVKNQEWVMKYGYANGGFQVSQEELQVCKGDVNAYMDVIQNVMAGSLSGLDRTVSTYLSGDRFGTLFQIAAGDGDTTTHAITFATGTAVTLTIPKDVRVKIGIGSRLVFASSGTYGTAERNSPLAGSSVDAFVYVTGISGNKITVKPVAALNGVSVYEGDYVQLHGNRLVYNGTGTGFEGLRDILVSGPDRTALIAGTYWDATFRGVDRSPAPEAFAGQYVDGTSATGNTPITDTVMKLYEATTVFGMGLDNVLIMNPEVMTKINKEALAVNEIRKSVDGKKRVASFGLSDFSVALGDMQSGDVIRDVSFPVDKVYSLNAKSDLKLYEVNNVGSVLKAVQNDEIGKTDIDSVSTMGINGNNPAQLNLDQLFTVYGPYPTNDGSGAVTKVGMNLRGNFKLERISASGVADIA